ncbi:zonadhesin-like [Elgaria multicarinata webbii]|uniref:zonadhesin-like n=1 Tax=Elgaria multicarinata webbii TaxID=159646 RepID=UPI002FCCBDED
MGHLPYSPEQRSPAPMTGQAEAPLAHSRADSPVIVLRNGHAETLASDSSRFHTLPHEPASDPLPFLAGSCVVSGDPHYYTFDKQTHHFMGNCTYTLSQLCNQTSPPLPYFNVEATNEHRGGNTQVSYVQSVDVDVLGLRITLEKGGTAKVDGEEVVVPSTPKRGLQILPSGFYTVVSTDFGLKVKYDGNHQVEVTLPSPYKNLVCGMCGNYNGNPQDDFLNPRGEREPDSTSLGNSWQVSNLTSCSAGPPPLCTEAEKEAAQSSSFCGLLTDAAGPFRHCHGTINPTGHFDGCLYDQCALHLDPGSLCRSLQSYADACLSLGVLVEPWRNATFCRKFLRSSSGTRSLPPLGAQEYLGRDTAHTGLHGNSAAERALGPTLACMSSQGQFSASSVRDRCQKS